jgi:hypothetical protein
MNERGKVLAFLPASIMITPARSAPMRASIRLLSIFISIVLMGCGGTPTSLLIDTPTRVMSPTVLPTPVPTATTTIPPLASPTATIIVPTRAPLPTATLAPSRTPTVAAGKMNIKLFFVALDDNGKSGKKIGCNDSIVAVDRAIPTTQAPLTAALKELLSIKERNIGQSGLYNALAQATLTIDSVAVVNGKAIIQLSGTLSLGGVCDDPRAEAQLKELALQFSTVRDVSIFINGKPIDQVLSGKGN